MLLKHDFALMAHYNQWMNTRLYAAAAALDEPELRADRGAFFGSILSTLHHIYTADAHWMQRFARGNPTLGSLDGVRTMVLPDLVRGITQPDFAGLRGDREAMDATIIAFTEEADETDYARTLHYTNTAGEPHAKPFALVLRHFFNHQTHHRGQVSTLFSQLGVDIGSTDLVTLIPERE